ncbi:MAG: HEAT repeat domain-containing protein [Planctomycetales bacterium]|nr:HEAT repeat domain-containing protein [Planctomycetales bacterium]
MGKQQGEIREPSQKDVAWAWTFLQELVDDKHGNLTDLSGISRARHVAIGSIIDEAVVSPSSAVRAWAYWLLGEVHFVPEDAYEALLDGMQTADEEVRLAALWAAGKIPDFAEHLVPALIDAAGDSRQGVQFAAVSSLAELGALAVAAVPALLQCVDTAATSDIRYLAVEALSMIAPDDPVVQDKLVAVLCDDDSSVRMAAAAGFARTAHRTTIATDAVRKRLADDDEFVAHMAAWALSTAVDENLDVVPDLLHALKRVDWWDVPPYGDEIPVRIRVRDDFEQALDLWLPEVEHDLLNSFRSHFLKGAFHPDAPIKQWLAETADHKFYRRIQRSRFPKAQTPLEHQRRRQFVETASNKFLERLRRNPSLGITPERYRELPGFIKQHSRNIAWRLRKKKEKLWLPMSFEPAATTTPDDEAEQRETSTLLAAFLQSELSPEERAVVEWSGLRGRSMEETAAALRLSLDTVVRIRRRALSKIRRGFRFGREIT